jgi:galactokinase
MFNGENHDQWGERIRRFEQLYSHPATHLIRAPGRVNLIGEHTDYNDGFVLPAAIDRAAYIVARPRDDQKLHAYAVNMDESTSFSLAELEPGKFEGWTAYIAGMADFLQRDGHQLVGADLLIEGDVPLGAGLSSSAALEVAVGATLLALAGIEVDRIALARVGQQTEHQYLRVQSGIMDQMISALGKQEHALLIDCRDYTTQPIPLHPDVRLVVCNSNVKRELGKSGYNERRAQCDEAVRILQGVLPNVKALRNVNSQQLEEHAHLLPPVVLRRARHVVTENERVLESADVLRNGNLQRFGQLMQAAHASYRDDFEASIPEIEVLVDAALAVPGVYGSRLTGGGFGGCTVSLVQTDTVERFVEQVTQAYEQAVGKPPTIYICEAANGVEVIEL